MWNKETEASLHLRGADTRHIRVINVLNSELIV